MSEGPDARETDRAEPAGELPGWLDSAPAKVLSAFGGLLSAAAAAVSLSDFATNDVGLLLATAGWLLIIGPTAFILLYYWNNRTVRHAVFVTQFMIFVGVLIVGQTLNGRMSDDIHNDSLTGTPRTGGSTTATASEPVVNCEHVPDVRGDPARRRSCDAVSLSGDEIDLDSTSSSWGAPEVTYEEGADLGELNGRLSGNLSGPGERLSIVRGTPSFQQCNAATNWESSYTLTELSTGDAVCVKTSEGRLAIAFVANEPADEIDMEIVVWESATDASTPSASE